MSGINPTIETDLVGEVVAYMEIVSEAWRVVARGRVRAVTASGSESALVLWLEIVDEEAKCLGPSWLDVAIGDIFRVYVDPSHTHKIRLIRP